VGSGLPIVVARVTGVTLVFVEFTLSLDPWSDRVTGMDVARAVLSVCSGVT